MSSHVRILGIAGSLRRGSYNQAALCAKSKNEDGKEVEPWLLEAKAGPSELLSKL